MDSAEQASIDERWMTRALFLAKRGEGRVEPNPMVGCVIVKKGHKIGEGWHQAFGGPHAEIEALRSCTEAPSGATMYVTLEPCCHAGKTPPCTRAIIESGVGRVVAAQQDPDPRVSGQGLAELKAAGIATCVGVLESRARYLNAPYITRQQSGRPWIIAKWAMTVDGKIATRSGSSKWISNESSRALVHQLRGRVDAIVVGAGTAMADDPMLTARPPGPRIARRVVFDSSLRLPLESQLVSTAREFPTTLVVGPQADAQRIEVFRARGCEVWQSQNPSADSRLREYLVDLAQQGSTNVLVEGGAKFLGTLFDQQLVDEVYAFIAPIIAGGQSAPSPVGGVGTETMQSALRLIDVEIQSIDGDVLVTGRLPRHGNG